MEDEIIWNVQNGATKEVEQLLKSDNDINKMYKGRTALHYAADYGQVEMISLLISKGAKVDAEDCYSMTPLCAAVLENHTKCAEVLIKNGADVHGKTPDGRTFLEAAKDDEMKKLLQN